MCHALCKARLAALEVENAKLKEVLAEVTDDLEHNYIRAMAGPNKERFEQDMAGVYRAHKLLGDRK
jgi:hypothetical protein